MTGQGSGASARRPGGGAVFALSAGARVEAVYHPQVLAEYAGIPVLEALPPIRSREQVAEALAFYPPYDDAERAQPAPIRKHMIGRLRRFLQPLDKHLHLDERLSRLLRDGYVERAPMLQEHPHGLPEASRAAIRASLSELAGDGTTATGLTILGTSGIGKSTALLACLRLYPQIIVHSEYAGEPFVCQQLVWLKLDCPSTGSLRGLCIAFFRALDRLLGTAYEKNYAKTRGATIETMCLDMAEVIRRHHLGVLAIDEVQGLVEAGHQNRTRMLNYFTSLANETGVSIVLVGTYKAANRLNRDFRRGRRGLGAGDFEWRPMPRGSDDWQLFVETLWSYQYTRTATPLSPRLLEVLHDETQGITDLAVKLYQLAQERAIDHAVSDPRERITVGVLRSVARDSFASVRHVLHALRTRNDKDLERLADVVPEWIVTEDEWRSPHATGIEFLGGDRADETADAPAPAAPGIATPASDGAVSGSAATSAQAVPGGSRRSGRSTGQRAARARRTGDAAVPPPDGLLAVGGQSTAYDALRGAGVVADVGLTFGVTGERDATTVSQPRGTGED